MPDSGAGGKVEEGGYRSDMAETVRVETPPTDPAAGNEMISHTGCPRRQLIRFLNCGSDYFIPGEVRPIVRAVRRGRTCNYSCIHSQTPARKNCGNSHNIILEYEESMQVWEEIEDTGELDSSGTDSEEEEELIGEDLLEDLDKAMVTINPLWSQRRARVTSAGPRGFCDKPS